MMNDSDDELKTEISGYSSDELIALASINAKYYRKETIDLAKSELFNRGIVPLEEEILFDLIVDSNNYAGRLILIGEELLFLSTGLSESISFPDRIFGGMVGGSLNRQSHNSMLTLAAQKLNMRAIDREGSWSYFLNQISFLENQSTLLGGEILKISGTDENGKFAVQTIESGLTPSGEFKQATASLHSAVLSCR